MLYCSGDDRGALVEGTPVDWSRGRVLGSLPLVNMCTGGFAVGIGGAVLLIVILRLLGFFK